MWSIMANFLNSLLIIELGIRCFQFSFRSPSSSKTVVIGQYGSISASFIDTIKWMNNPTRKK